MMVESLSVEEEDGEFKREKAKEKVISILPRKFLFFTRTRDAWKNVMHGAWCCLPMRCSHRQ
jgi:hypothetical protein